MILNIWKSRRQSEAGFTMVEMMVTIAIIGILASISIPVFLNQRKVAVDGMVESDIRSAVLMVEAWKNQNHESKVMPFALSNTGPGTTTISGAANVTGPLKEIKVSSGTSLYVYTGERPTSDDTTAPLGSYTIMARNADGKTSGPDSSGLGRGIQYDSQTSRFICVNNAGGEIACE